MPVYRVYAECWDPCLNPAVSTRITRFLSHGQLQPSGTDPAGRTEPLRGSAFPAVATLTLTRHHRPTRVPAPRSLVVAGLEAEGVGHSCRLFAHPLGFLGCRHRVAFRLLQYAANRSLWLDEALVAPVIANPPFGSSFTPGRGAAAAGIPSALQSSRWRCSATTSTLSG